MLVVIPERIHPGSLWKFNLAKHRKMSLRKRNCERIARAFLPHFNPHAATLSWLVNYLDPISSINLHKTDRRIRDQDAYMKFWCQSTQVHVPLSWYWREIEDWEIESLVTIWKLSHEY